MRHRAVWLHAALRPQLYWAKCLGLVAILCLTMLAGSLPTEAQTPPNGKAPESAPPAAPTAANLGELASQLQKSPDTVVADVNGTPITLGMVADRIRDFPDKLAVLPSNVVYRSAVEDLIEQRAMAIKAKQMGLDKLPETKRRIEEVSDRELSKAALRRVLPEMVTDQALKELYNAQIANKPGPEAVRFRVIATETEADAQTVLLKLAAGGDFNKLALQYSRDPSAPQGGEVGFATRDRLIPAFAALAFGLAPGQTTAYPIPVGGFWFILQVEERRETPPPSFDEARKTLTAELDRQAALTLVKKARAAVVVVDYGATGATASNKPGDIKQR